MGNLSWLKFVEEKTVPRQTIQLGCFISFPKVNNKLENFAAKLKLAHPPKGGQIFQPTETLSTFYNNTAAELIRPAPFLLQFTPTVYGEIRELVFQTDDVRRATVEKKKKVGVENPKLRNVGRRRR